MMNEDGGYTVDSFYEHSPDTLKGGKNAVKKANSSGTSNHPAGLGHGANILTTGVGRPVSIKKPINGRF